MALPPVIAELRANTAQYMSRMAEARKSWEGTAAAIGDTAPMAAAESHLAMLGSHAAETTRATGALGETSRETFGQMQSGLATLVPGYGELAGVLGRVSEQFTHIGESSRTSFQVASRNAEALRIELDRVNQARLVSLERLSQLEAGSRAWTIETAKVDQFDAHINALNRNLARTVELQTAAGRGVIGAKVKAGAGGVAAVGIAAAAVVGYESVKAAVAEEQQLALLRNAVEKTKQSWEDYEPALESAQEQLRKLGVSDGDTARSAQTLTTALKDPEKALNLVGLAANIARARHIDLAAATATVSKIATGHTGSMSRLGLASKDAAGHTYTAKQAIDALGKAYGGASATYAGTLQGKWDILKAQAEHVAVQIGTRLIPILSDLLTKFMELSHWLNENVVPVLKALAGFYEDHAKLINGVVVALVAAVAAFKLITIAVGIFNAVMDANPISLVIVAVAALAAGLIYAYKNSETFRRIVDATFSALKTASLDAARVFVNYYVAPQVEGYLFIGRAMGKLVGVAAKLPKWLGGGIASDVQGAINDLVNTVAGGLHAIQAELNQTSADAYQTTSALAGMALINANLANAQLRYKKDLAASAGDNVLAADLANIAKLKAQAAAPPPKSKATEDPFNISGGYADGVKNVADASKKAKALHDKAAADAKKRREAEKKALADQKAHLKAEADAALRAAQYVADKRAAQLQAALNAANEAARQLDVANKLAGGGPGNLNIYDGAILNRGTSFAQAAARAGGTSVINVNVAGRVTTEKDLLAALHEGLLTFNRTNINAGLN